MARIRTIKPEFWTDDTIIECSLSARFLFIGIWNFADDYGNLDRSAKQIKARVFPADSIDCEPLIQELIDRGLLVEYSVDAKKYLHIPGFTKHQKINRPSLPQVPGFVVTPKLSEPSVSPHSGMEGNGGEGKGREVTRAESRDVPRQTFEKIQATYPRGTYREANWQLAEREIGHRLDEGESLPDLVAAAAQYALQQQALGKVGTQYVMSPHKFYDGTGHWRGPFPHPPSKAQVAQDANLEASRQWLEQGT